MLRGFQGKRLFAALLCMLMIMSAMIVMPHSAFADDADEKETIDYILILDCTVRAVDADAEGVRKAAAKMFVDLIPVDNARVAVFKIGDRDVDAQYGRADKAKSYKVRKDDGHMANELYRMQCIYQLWDFDQPISTINQREELKTIIDKAYIQTQGGFSDTHCAAYAAMDTLKYWDSKNACILLVSEEFTASYNNHLVLNESGNRVDSDHTMWDDVQHALNANRNWIFNWVDLGNGTPEIRTIIDGLCRMNGGEACYDFSISRLPEKIATIVSKYTGSNEEGQTRQLDSTGNASIELPDFVMLTEANVVVTGDGVQNVTVVDGRGSKIEKPKDDIWFSTNYDPADKSQFLYSAVKMIRPSSGAWTVNVKGKAGTQVYVQTIHTLEPDLLMKCHYEKDSDGLIGVGTKLQFTITYQYAGEDLHCGQDAYNHYLKEARLYYTHSSNPDKKEDISNTLRVEGEQYVSDFTVNKRGTYNFYFYVESNDFKSGIRNANSIEKITVANHTPKAQGTLSDINDIAVGTHLDAVMNITEHFSDEDNEALTYHIDCSHNGRNAEVNYLLHDDGYLSIDVPAVEGDYEFAVYAEDTNGAQSDVLKFTLKAVNESPKLMQKTPLKVRMIANAPQLLINLGLLPKDEYKDFYIALDDVFVDPEGLPMEFEVDLNGTTDKEGNEIVSAELDREAQAISVLARNTGKASVLVLAKDSSNATETFEISFNVRTVGNVLAERYWWVPVIIVIVILIVLALLASRRVRGSWNIEVTDVEQHGYCTHSFSSLPSSKDRKLKKTKVSLLSIVKCAVRKEESLEDIQTNALKDKVIVFKGSLALGKGVKFVYTPMARITASIDDAQLTKGGTYTLKKNQSLTVDCKDASDSDVLNVKASFH